ncbi:MAG: hypothetical protein RIC04_00305 [Parvibaculum sp.]|uniref:hypothetical protein n=1 Tax=Parvibaculum sp. TaxID=2024848 RepID=UPI0032ED4D0D
MGLFSNLIARRKLEPPAPVETPRVTQAALKRALRSTAMASGSQLAAELGQRIATALSTVETAVLAIDAVTERLREAADLVADAGRNADIGRRALLAGRYDDVRAEIDAIVGSASHNRVNLIGGRRIGGQHTSFEIALDGEDRAGISIAVINLTTGESGLSLSPPRSAFADDAEIEAISAEIGAARISAAAAAERFSDHAALIADRLARLIAIAGSHPVETQLPTGADAEDPDTPVHPDTEYELGMGAVEEKLRALATRLNGDGAKDTGGADT